MHEIGHDDGIPFIVSDYIDGCSLSEWLADRKPSFRQSAAMIAEIARRCNTLTSRESSIATSSRRMS